MTAFDDLLDLIEDATRVGVENQAVTVASGERRLAKARTCQRFLFLERRVRLRGLLEVDKVAFEIELGLVLG